MIKPICKLDTTQWHKWFAWYPVSTTEVFTGTHYCHKRIWWQYVWRRSEDNGFDCDWFYREIV